MLIKNRYKLCDVLSEGAYSTIWIANDKKRMSPQYQDSEVIV